MDFILNRNKTVSSTRGHTITFIKDEPVHVPDDMHTDVMAIGAIPVDELPDTEAKLPSEPQGAEREKAVRKREEMISSMEELMRLREEVVKRREKLPPPQTWNGPPPPAATAGHPRRPPGFALLPSDRRSASPS